MDSFSRPARSLRWAAASALLLLAALSPLLQAQASRQEELNLYYQKWLDEDVVYIITEEERSVFSSLQTPDEKDRFIEQFWRRRDPDPATAENEFKLEHYRRIAYVNERYFSGVPGWKSDRGKMYIRFGPPDEIEKQPYGGPYRRRNSEGGGEATVFPFERWWYRNIEGVGQDIEIEFVDRNFSNEYRISLNPNDKDAFLFTPGLSNTQAEFDGQQTRFDRLSAPLGVDPNSMQLHYADLPFVKLRRWAQLQKAPDKEQARLQELVNTRIRYEQLPFEFKSGWLKLEQEALVPLTVSLRYADLQFGADGKGPQARVGIYGRVTALNGEIAANFEDEIVADKSVESLAGDKWLYQRMLVLPPGRYRLDLVMEDSYSGKVGVLQTGLAVPRLQAEKLSASPLVFVDRVEPAPQPSDSTGSPEMFVVGNLKILPRLENSAQAGQYLMFYFELYDAAFDSASQAPDLRLKYQLLDSSGAVAAEKEDEGGRRAVYVSKERVAFLEYLPLKAVPGGAATLRIRARDAISGQELTLSEAIRIDEAQ